jgi:acetylglutamate kinase
MLAKMNVESRFVDGLRVTDEKTMEVAQMVLCGSINKEIAALLSSKQGVRGAVGLSGLDSELILSTQKDKKLGLVGSLSLSLFFNRFFLLLLNIYKMKINKLKINKLKS